MKATLLVCACWMQIVSTITKLLLKKKSSTHRLRMRLLRCSAVRS
ncbi:Uncharacterised protein [Vibrio cholerae]|nr:Uncharacterised protein [Vibrio cholerae]CSI70767.1 Uncharacterised protein [Vibrio cholerae]